MLNASMFAMFYMMNLSFSQDFPTVSTPSGSIRGHYLISFKGQKYEAYEGIPYALPPVGDRRFEPPQAIESWSGDILADKFREACIGYNRNPAQPVQELEGIEDCLYLNVYVPKKASDEPLPVIFWIFGGAFQYSTLLGTEQHYLIDHNVIFVSMNYRLGVLGFLSTEDEVVSGNMGLKDQSIALQWVSKNIKYFNGDPQKIMLAGLSAGGASVHYHYLSPMSKGLFRTGLSLSGTAFDCWAQARNSRRKALKLGELMNCPTIDMRDLIDCLKKRPAQDLVRAQTSFMFWHLIEITPFGPVTEELSPKPFIDRSPIEIIRSGDVDDVPWITGVVSQEGLYPVGEFATNDTVLKEVDENWESIAPHLLQYYYTIPKDEHANVGRRIRKDYFGTKPINRENVSILINLTGDRLFVIDAEKAAREQARVNKSPVWFYYYSYRANDSFSEIMTRDNENLGVCHTDDALLVLETPIVNPTKTKKDISMLNELIRFWTSIARTGYPSHYSQWQKVDPGNRRLKYLRIENSKNIHLQSDKNFGQKRFWHTIFFNENQVN